MSTRGGKLPMLKHNYRMQLANRQSLIEQLQLKVAELEKTVRHSQEEQKALQEQWEEQLNTTRDELGRTVAELEKTQQELQLEKDQSEIRKNAIHNLEVQLKMERENFELANQKRLGAEEQLCGVQQELKQARSWMEDTVIKMKKIMEECEASMEEFDDYM